MGSGVVVIGAGPAGLTAAYELDKLGFRPTVLEADGQVGGLSRTVNYRGYRFDIGGHRFFSKVPLINEYWRAILGEEFLLRPRQSRIYYNNTFFDYPLRAGNALRGLGLLESIRCGLSYARARLAPSRAPQTFEDWVTNQFGRRLFRIFFKTYTEKVWGIPCHEISADWAAQRIRNLSLGEAVRSALFGGNGKSRDGTVITTLIDQFHYPRLGPGQMWERCEAILAERGHATQRGVRVDRIRHRGGRVEAVCATDGAAGVGWTGSAGVGPRDDRRGGSPVEFAADQFISTMPLRDLVLALDPPPPADVIAAARRLRYRDYLTVVLIVNRAEVFSDNWIYIHSPDVKMGRIQNYKNWSPAMAPDPSRTSLGLEYFLWEHDPEWRWPDDRLIELGIDECVRLRLVERSEVEDGVVVRMTKAYPVYDGAYHEALAVIRRYLDTLANVQTVGRNGLHRYNNQDHSMLSAIYAARNLAGERHDVWSVNVDQEYHEESRESDGQRIVKSASLSSERLVPRRREERRERTKESRTTPR